jgi:hypothetical protein
LSVHPGFCTNLALRKKFKHGRFGLLICSWYPDKGGKQ